MKLDHEGVSACTACRLHKSAECGKPTLGIGPKRAKVMVIDESTRLYPSRATKLRDAWLSEFFDLDDVYFCYAVACSPPKGKSPTKGELKKCSVWVRHQIEVIKPKYVLLLGNSPLQSITGAAGITKRRGIPFEESGIIYMPTFHPSSTFHDEDNEAIIQRDLDTFAGIVENGGIPREKSLNNRLVRSRDDFHAMLRAMKGTVSFDIESTALNPWQINNPDTGEFDPARVTMIGFGTASGEFSIPVDDYLQEGGRLPVLGEWSNVKLCGYPILKALKMIEEALDDCFVVCHNGKFDMLWMWAHFGCEWWFDFDTMMAHYILNENARHGLKELATRYFNAPNWDVDKDTKKGHVSVEKQALYHAHDLHYTRRLRFSLGKELKKDRKVERVFWKIIMPVFRIFMEMQYDGIVVDTTKFGEAEKFLRDIVDECDKSLSRWGDIEWTSPKQLANHLYQTLGIECPLFTAKGNPSVNESALNQIDHKCVGDLLRLRGARQQLSFFIEGWKPHLHWVNGIAYLHPSFKLHGTVTGRPSCELPNLYQVPRDPRIRTLVTSEDGWTFCELDLSQIELRIAAELANEPTMIDAFRKGIDIHWLTAIREIERGQGLKDLVVKTACTAKQVKQMSYGDALEVLLEIGPDIACDIDSSWKEYRKKAKPVNFGYLYGMWWKKFKIYARDNYQVNITDDQAKASRVFYFETYRKLIDWHKRQKRFVREEGYVRSLSGRKRRLPDAMRADGSSEAKQAERQAINSPVQSFANELNFMSAIQLRKEYGRDKVRICGTVYDAILMRVKNEYVEEVVERLLQIMSQPPMLKEFGIKLKVPIMAEAKIGPWGAGISFEKWRGKKREAKTGAVRKRVDRLGPKRLNSPTRKLANSEERVR
jgi:DNA polymerase-1